LVQTGYQIIAQPINQATKPLSPGEFFKRAEPKVGLNSIQPIRRTR
jgi:hypothetical protein